ncbi:MAG TPA: OmpA family protein [Rhizomicrobium sp.]
MRKILAGIGLLGLAGCGSMGMFSAPPPAYAVFFDAHDVSLTPAGKTIVDDAAKDAKLHADRLVQISSPSKQSASDYDPALAEARTRVVEQALIADGVAPGRLVRASSTAALKASASGAQRVDIRLIGKPGS